MAAIFGTTNLMFFESYHHFLLIFLDMLFNQSLLYNQYGQKTIFRCHEEGVSRELAIPSRGWR